MREHSLRKTRHHIKKATKQQQTNKIQKQRSATHCDVRHGTSCCDVRRAGGSRGTSFNGDSYKSMTFVVFPVVVEAEELRFLYFHV